MKSWYAFAVAASLLAGCGGGNSAENTSANSDFSRLRQLTWTTQESPDTSRELVISFPIQLQHGTTREVSLRLSDDVGISRTVSWVGAGPGYMYTARDGTDIVGLSFSMKQSEVPDTWWSKSARVNLTINGQTISDTTPTRVFFQRVIP